MANVDKQAAKRELRQAAQLHDKADKLANVADELRYQAQRLEHDAEQLVAPDKPTPQKR